MITDMFDIFSFVCINEQRIPIIFLVKMPSLLLMISVYYCNYNLNHTYHNNTFNFIALISSLILHKNN